MIEPETNWGLVELDVIRHIAANIPDDFAKYVRSTLSESAADDMAKGYNTIFTWSQGTRAGRSATGNGNGFIQLNEQWAIVILIYSQDGRVDDAARFGAKGIHSVAALVKGIVNAYCPSESDQKGCDGVLELTRDEPASDYQNEAGTVGQKIRQTYVLKTILRSQVTGAAAA